MMGETHGFLVTQDNCLHTTSAAQHSRPPAALACCRVLDFAEVTALFQQLAPAQSAQSAQNAAVEALLMADRTMDARLSRREFGLMLTK